MGHHTTTTEAEERAAQAAQPVQLRITSPSLADLPQGVWFTFVEDATVYIACGSANDGGRTVVNPVTGHMMVAKAHAPCTPFGAIDVVLRPRI